MTTELVLLLCVFAFVTAGAIFGEKGPFKVIESTIPRLGARIEQNIAIGHQFKVRNTNGSQSEVQWHAKDGSNGPDGKL